MATFWKGSLKLSLVTCAVGMTPATSEREKIRFHILNRATGNRVESRSVDAKTGEPVAEEDEVKAYQEGEEAPVFLEDDELDDVALDSTRTIAIDMFVPRHSIPWIWYDKPHFLVPADAVGTEAFSVIREAMAATDTVGIARLVLYRRERAVMLKPRDKGVVLWTLRYGDEVRDQEGPTDGEKPEPDALALFAQLIERHRSQWAPSLVKDPVQENLRKIIAAKRRKPRKAPSAAPAEKASTVVSIVEALKRSIAQEKARR